MPELKDLISTILPDEPLTDLANDKTLFYDSSALALKSTALENMGGSTGEAGSLDFAGNPSNVDHGQFWTVDTEYTACYWSAWVKPIYPSITGYYISDGSGGAHNVLNGVSTGVSTFIFTGNIYDGSDIWTLSSVDTPPLGEWVHYEFIHVAGSNLYVTLNGIPTFYGKLTMGGVWTSTFTGNRSFPSGGSDGHLYAGGSYHNNFPGCVAKIRGIEGSSAGFTVNVVTNANVPRDYDGYVTHPDGTTKTRATFAADYSVPGTRSFINMGEGFESRVHHGAFSRYDATTAYPTWVAGEITPSTYVPTAPATPVGALVFDSFSRVNSLALFGGGDSPLGTTEAGSLGVKTWLTPYFDASNRGVGVLYGRAVIYPGQVGYARVLTDRTDVDIRVTRPSAPWASTGLIARYKDTDNYYIITGEDTVIGFNFRESGVTTFPSTFSVTTGWTVLRVVMNGTTMSVYTSVDGTSFTLAGTKTVINDAGALSHGIASAGPVSRFDDFTILATS